MTIQVPVRKQVDATHPLAEVEYQIALTNYYLQTMMQPGVSPQKSAQAIALKQGLENGSIVPYQVLTIPLDTAGVDQPFYLNLGGNLVAASDGTMAGITVKFGKTSNDAVPLLWFYGAQIPLSTIYVSWPAQAGKTLYIVIGSFSLAQFATNIDSQTAKLAGLPTVMGSVTKNWQAAEQDLITIGANGTSNKLHLCLIGIQALIGNIALRAYHRINGVERRIFPIPATTVFTAAGSAPGIPLIDTTGAITEALRVTVQSDNAADNGQAVTYEYKLEAM